VKRRIRKSGRKAKTLDEEIAAQREKLRKLEERQREQQRKERERNQKAVMELIKTERLDAVPS
jgi:Spy/CpxP family protein refolding chaperone